MPQTEDGATCPSCERQVDKQDPYRTNTCEVCGQVVCHDCMRRKQILPPGRELPAGAFRFRCKRHVRTPLGLGWEKIKRR